MRMYKSKLYCGTPDLYGCIRKLTFCLYWKIIYADTLLRADYSWLWAIAYPQESELAQQQPRGSGELLGSPGLRMSFKQNPTAPVAGLSHCCLLRRTPVCLYPEATGHQSWDTLKSDKFHFQVLSLRIKAAVLLLQGRCQPSTRQYHDRNNVLCKLWDAFECPVKACKPIFKFRCLIKWMPLGSELCHSTPEIIMN